MLYWAFSLVVPAFADLSPYPLSAKPLATVYTVAERGRSEEELVCLDTLAGNLARQQPQLYRVASADGISRSSGDSYSRFLLDLESSQQISVNASLATAPLAAIVAHWSSAVKGYVRTNAKDASVSAGLTFSAGSEGILVAAGDDVAKELEKAGLAQVKDLRGKHVADVIQDILPQLSERVFVFQDASEMTFLGDYAVFARAPTVAFGSEPDIESLLLRRAKGPAVAFGWGPENTYVTTMNQHKVYVHASNYNKNLAALSNVKDWTPSGLPKVKSDAATAVHTVAFVMSDGDNLQWTLGPWSVDAKWFGNERRGEVPLGWTFSPATNWLAPSVLHNVSLSLTQQDELIAGPSGVGYMYPTEWPDSLSDFAALTSRAMGKGHMRLLNVIGKNDDVPDRSTLAPLLEPENIDGMIYYPFGGGYSGLRGAVWFVNGKPVVSGRYSLWGEAASGLMLGVDALVKALATLPKDPASVSGYSIIPVHAWSHTYADVARVAAGLKEAGGFEVVLPSELLRRVGSLGRICHCDHVGASAPGNGYTCNDARRSAFCSTKQRCVATGDWTYPPTSWSQICAEDNNTTLTAVVV
eukprot:TRINITY_DN41747_c0_g1_i1.p1 TRINITY_DN41747_c0_g1~~TRINITY_DN41747_c0_g1_i1.p1  ORF type:complete len:583 (+),score=77.00 TRINITY_DN41747_c0_g1_i1:137-1885(+)